MIRPLRDLLVIKPDKEPGRIGLIFIPDMGSSGNKTGCVCTVMAKGPDAKEVSVGDKVLVQAYGSHPAGDEVTINGELHTLIRQRDLDGVLS